MAAVKSSDWPSMAQDRRARGKSASTCAANHLEVAADASVAQTPLPSSQSLARILPHCWFASVAALWRQSLSIFWVCLARATL